MDEPKNSGQEAQELLLRVNKFYRDHYHRVMQLLTIFVVVGVALAAVLAWMSFDRKQPPYYASVISGKVMPLHSLSEPVVSQQFILEWSALTARLVYNLSFATYQSQLEQIRNRFTDDGWNKLMSALQSSGFINNLVNNHLQVNSIVTGTPLIVHPYPVLEHGRVTWLVQMKILVTYQSASATQHQHLVVTMKIQRVPTLDAPQGIQVVDFVT